MPGHWKNTEVIYSGAPVECWWQTIPSDLILK